MLINLVIEYANVMFIGYSPVSETFSFQSLDLDKRVSHVRGDRIFNLEHVKNANLGDVVTVCLSTRSATESGLSTTTKRLAFNEHFNKER